MILLWELGLVFTIVKFGLPYTFAFRQPMTPSPPHINLIMLCHASCHCDCHTHTPAGTFCWPQHCIMPTSPMGSPVDGWSRHRHGSMASSSGEPTALHCTLHTALGQHLLFPGANKPDRTTSACWLVSPQVGQV